MLAWVYQETDTQSVCRCFPDPLLLFLSWPRCLDWGLWGLFQAAVVQDLAPFLVLAPRGHDCLGACGLVTALWIIYALSNFSRARGGGCWRSGFSPAPLYPAESKEARWKILTQSITVMHECKWSKCDWTTDPTHSLTSGAWLSLSHPTAQDRIVTWFCWKCKISFLFD